MDKCSLNTHEFKYENLKKASDSPNFQRLSITIFSSLLLLFKIHNSWDSKKKNCRHSVISQIFLWYFFDSILNGKSDKDVIWIKSTDNFWNVFFYFSLKSFFDNSFSCIFSWISNLFPFPWKLFFIENFFVVENWVFGCKLT